MTDPLFPSEPGRSIGDDITTGECADPAVTGADGPDGGLVLGDLSTPGSGDATFTATGDPSEQAAFYTHSGTPCD